jgi:hypothetical protein
LSVNRIKAVGINRRFSKEYKNEELREVEGVGNGALGEGNIGLWGLVLVGW